MSYCMHGSFNSCTLSRTESERSICLDEFWKLPLNTDIKASTAFQNPLVVSERIGWWRGVNIDAVGGTQAGMVDERPIICGRGTERGWWGMWEGSCQSFTNTEVGAPTGTTSHYDDSYLSPPSTLIWISRTKKAFLPIKKQRHVFISCPFSAEWFFNVILLKSWVSQSISFAVNLLKQFVMYVEDWVKIVR